jgi:hypothetical protein
MPKLLASQSRVTILPVELPVRPWPFAIFTLKGRTLSPAVDRFIAHLRDFARSMQASSALPLRMNESIVRGGRGCSPEDP